MASVIPFTTVTDYYILSDIWISDVRRQIWNSWPRVWNEIWRLLLKSLAEVLEIKYLVQEHRPRICKLVLKSRLKSWTDTKTLGRKFQSLAKGFRCEPDIWSSDIRYNVVICYYILIILIFFYTVNLRTRFDEALGLISDPRNFGWGSED